MAFQAKKMSVTGDAAAVLVYRNPVTSKQTEIGRDVVVTVANTSANTVYLGGSSATTDGTNGSGAADSNAGLPVAAAASKDVVLQPGDELYVFAHTTSTINVAANGQ